MNLNEKLSGLGFYRADGTLIPLHELTSQSLEYVNFADTQLKDMLNHELQHERYERCAGIRDELLRRAGNLNAVSC